MKTKSPFALAVGLRADDRPAPETSLKTATDDFKTQRAKPPLLCITARFPDFMHDGKGVFSSGAANLAEFCLTTRMRHTKNGFCKPFFISV